MTPVEPRDELAGEGGKLLLGEHGRVIWGPRRRTASERNWVLVDHC